MVYLVYKKINFFLIKKRKKKKENLGVSLPITDSFLWIYHLDLNSVTNCMSDL